MQPPTTLVLVLNGPRRRDDGGIQHHRVQAGADLALKRGHPVLIAGDANNGLDLAEHEAYARRFGVPSVFRAYDPGGRTISDVRAAISFLLYGLPETHELFRRISGILLVTDQWHLPRALAMLQGELHARLGSDHPYTLDAFGVSGGEPPTEEMLRGEEQGLQDYLAGKYGPSPYAPVGKPVLPPPFAPCGDVLLHATTFGS